MKTRLSKLTLGIWYQVSLHMLSYNTYTIHYSELLPRKILILTYTPLFTQKSASVSRSMTQHIKHKCITYICIMPQRILRAIHKVPPLSHFTTLFEESELLHVFELFILGILILLRTHTILTNTRHQTCYSTSFFKLILLTARYLTQQAIDLLNTKLQHYGIGYQ